MANQQILHLLTHFIFQLSLGLIVLSQTTTFYSAITVYIIPPASSYIGVACWSNNSQAFQSAWKNFSNPGDVSWKVTGSSSYYNGYYDVYWCRARMGSDILTRFPVYGDGIERNSSEWLINSKGKRRLSLENNRMDDRRESWTPT